MTVRACLMKHMGKDSPINAYRADMAGDVAELVALGRTDADAWLEVIDNKVDDLEAEQERITRDVAAAYAKAKPARA